MLIRSRTDLMTAAANCGIHTSALHMPEHLLQHPPAFLQLQSPPCQLTATRAVVPTKTSMLEAEAAAAAVLACGLPGGSSTCSSQMQMAQQLQSYA
jgi:hypothetical protein